jgi:hypothetical protein
MRKPVVYITTGANRGAFLALEDPRQTNGKHQVKVKSKGMPRPETKRKK